MSSVLDRARAAVTDRLSSPAAAHSIGASETAAEMARRAGLDADDAALAGLLHDWSREEPDAELLAYARDAGMELCELDVDAPHLLHARVGSHRVSQAFPEADAIVLAAIGSHTLGAVAMGPLAKLVYVADMVEPGRDFDGVEALRHAVRTSDVDEAFRIAMSRTMEHLVRSRKPIHPSTVAVWNAHVATGRVAGKRARR